jgi:hypothetical protein
VSDKPTLVVNEDAASKQSNAIRWKARPKDEELQNVLRVIWLLLFGDFIYAVLPLIVLAVLTRLLKEPFQHFLELKEWSFATIVIMGASIQRFVRLKADMHQDPTSFKLATGLQQQIDFLIISVLVLVLVILVEKHIIPEDKSQYLGYAQLILFLLGVHQLAACIYYEDVETEWLDNLPACVKTKRHLLVKVKRDLAVAEMYVQRIAEALSEQLDARPSERPSPLGLD